ncbi:hypothetical protein G4B88_030291, partial [Cannabis sativa]
RVTELLEDRKVAFNPLK